MVTWRRVGLALAFLVWLAFMLAMNGGGLTIFEWNVERNCASALWHDESCPE